MPVKVFCSYSRLDRDLKGELEEHLSPLVHSGRITAYWSDDRLTAGTEFDPVIRGELEAADLILVLLTASYYNSDYCRDVELRRALARHDEGRARIVLTLLRDMMWDVPPINKYSIIPRNRTAVTSSPNRDEAFAEIAREINRVIKEVEDHLALTEEPPGALRRLPRHVMAPVAPTPIADAPEPSVFHCVPRLDDPAVLRSTGITELLPDLVLQFRGDPGERHFADLWVYANACITSRIMGQGNLSEASLSLATAHSITGLPTLRHNIWARQGSIGALGFLHVPLHELRAVPPAERNLRIANVRVNAAMLGASINEPRALHLLLKMSDATVTPQQLFVAHVAANFHVHISSADPKLDLTRCPQGQPMNTGMLTERRTADHWTMLMTCTGRLAGYEPFGERTRILARRVQCSSRREPICEHRPGEQRTHWTVGHPDTNRSVWERPRERAKD
jgi:hypothetical protein